MLKKLFLLSLVVLHGNTTCMEIELYSPFSEIPKEIADYIVYQNDIATINSFSRTNHIYYNQYNADKTLLKHDEICASLSPKQHALRMIKSAQMTDEIMAERIIKTENQYNKHARQHILQYLKYKTIVHSSLNCIQCSLNAYKGIKSGYDKINDKDIVTAIYDNNYIILLIFIKNNASINIADTFGQTSLITATIQNNKSIVELFLTYNCKKNIQDKTGYTALHHACASTKIQEIAQILINNKVNLNIQSESGDTPLHIAIRKKNLLLAQQLIANGADTTIKNSRNKLALELTGKKNQKNLMTYIPTNKRTRTDSIGSTEEPVLKKNRK